MLKLYNTLTRSKEEFRPIDRTNVRLYACGPTVYDYLHIGNGRMMIVFDVLFRLLRHLYGPAHVTYARNITDVEDKINERAARDFPGMPLNDAIRTLTDRITEIFHEDVAALGCLPPTVEPRATEHIPEMRAIIERLVARGYAYVADDHVLFQVAKMDGSSGLPRYGALARRSLDDMIAGARIEVAPYKRDPMDFVLWKPSAPEEPGWPSPAGIATPGRPGWHIECSAMSMARLLAPFGGGLACDDPARNVFDIHGGGIDLVFPHHENEVAQSCCAFGAPRMANYWLHNGFLQVEGEKMSKSLGNFITIREIWAEPKFGGRAWPGAVFRLAMLRTQYRQPNDITVAALAECESILDRWLETAARARLADAALPDALMAAMLDDMNTPLAIAAIHDAVARDDADGSFAALRFLGLTDAESPAALLARKSSAEAEHLAGLAARGVDVAGLVAARLAARAARNWAEADRIRDALVAAGIQLMDGKDSDGRPVTTWEVKLGK
jgi:cysteinyl-tRNA synthetase